MLQRVMSRFSAKFFCLTVPKHFVEEPFLAVLQKISGSQKVYGYEEGVECQDFPSNFFCLTVPKNAVGEPFSLSLISGMEKVWIRGWGGLSRFSVEIFVSHSAEKLRRGTLLCCVSENFR